MGTRHLYWILTGPSFAVYIKIGVSFRNIIWTCLLMLHTHCGVYLTYIVSAHSVCRVVFIEENKVKINIS